MVRAYPKVYRPDVFRPDTRLWLRRYHVAQFVIIYAHIESRDSNLPDVVSIRAVRHVREKDVFAGVKEHTAAPAWGAPVLETDDDDMDTWDCIIDHENDIDWDNIMATTEQDDKAGRYLFNSADYATWDEAMIALRELIHSLGEKARRRAAVNTASDAAGRK